MALSLGEISLNDSRELHAGCCPRKKCGRRRTQLASLGHQCRTPYLVDPKVGVGVKVVIFGRHVLSVGLLAAFCLATGDLGGGEWEQMGSHLGAPHRFGSLQAGLYCSLEYTEHSPNRTRQPYSPQLPSCLSQEPPTPRAPSRRAPPIPQPGLPSLQSLCPRL